MLGYGTGVLIMSQPLDGLSNAERMIRESSDKIRVETQVKRGNATRDEDRIKVKVRGDDPDEVVEQLNQTIANLQETADTLREMQTGDGE